MLTEYYRPNMFAKLFASLYQGTLRGRAHEILVFTNLLAHCDAAGHVDKHFRAIAEEVGLTVDEVKTAIANLEAPDTESRSPELDGRRIVRLDEHRAWGWLVVNHGKYRAIKDEADRREQNRIAQAKFRERHGESKQLSASISSRKQPSAASAQAEAEAEADTNPQTPLAPITQVKPSGVATPDPGWDVITDDELIVIPKSLESPTFWASWQKWLKFRKGLGKKPKDWRVMFSSQLDWLATFGPTEATEILNQSMRNGWQGLFERKANNGPRTNQFSAGEIRNAGIVGGNDTGKAARVMARKRAEAAAAEAAKNAMAVQVVGHGDNTQ